MRSACSCRHPSSRRRTTAVSSARPRLLASVVLGAPPSRERISPKNASGCGGAWLRRLGPCLGARVGLWRAGTVGGRSAADSARHSQQAASLPQQLAGAFLHGLPSGSSPLPPAQLAPPASPHQCSACPGPHTRASAAAARHAGHCRLPVAGPQTGCPQATSGGRSSGMSRHPRAEDMRRCGGRRGVARVGGSGACGKDVGEEWSAAANATGLPPTPDLWARVVARPVGALRLGRSPPLPAGVQALGLGGRMAASVSACAGTISRHGSLAGRASPFYALFETAIHHWFGLLGGGVRRPEQGRGCRRLVAAPRLVGHQ